MDALFASSVPPNPPSEVYRVVFRILMTPGQAQGLPAGVAHRSASYFVSEAFASVEEASARMMGHSIFKVVHPDLGEIFAAPRPREETTLTWGPIEEGGSGDRRDRDQPEKDDPLEASGRREAEGEEAEELNELRQWLAAQQRKLDERADEEIRNFFGSDSDIDARRLATEREDRLRGRTTQRLCPRITQLPMLHCPGSTLRVEDIEDISESDLEGLSDDISSESDISDTSDDEGAQYSWSPDDDNAPDAPGAKVFLVYKKDKPVFAPVVLPGVDGSQPNKHGVWGPPAGLGDDIDMSSNDSDNSDDSSMLDSEDDVPRWLPESITPPTTRGSIQPRSTPEARVSLIAHSSHSSTAHVSSGSSRSSITIANWSLGTGDGSRTRHLLLSQESTRWLPYLHPIEELDFCRPALLLGLKPAHHIIRALDRVWRFVLEKRKLTSLRTAVSGYFGGVWSTDGIVSNWN
ncbi:hypothetical protein BC629DRAFT_1445801 [Irpex lacteus]|nr:hypothetical protein BC629DRAFT_1445801 [Irpex lacteus]